MEKIELGKSGLQVSRMGLGCMGMSEFYGPSDDAESLKVLERSFELGINFYDTADMYGHGHNEQLLAKFLKGRRDKVIIATKFGIFRQEKGKYERSINNSAQYMRQCLEGSLKRLNTDVIDLYYVHRLATDRPVEEVMGDLSRLKDEGKIRHIGLSEVSADTLRRAAKVHPVAAVQSEYSLVTRDVEQNGVLTACEETGTALVAYSPLGRGFLSAKLKNVDNLDQTDFRRANPRFQKENLDRNIMLLAKVEELAKRHGAEPSQIALAWVLHNEQVVPIPGTRRIKYLEQNAGAAGIHLTPQEIGGLEQVFAPGAVAGQRYPEEGMKGLDN